MDPKAGQLDPKLKEAYDRVMKTTITPPTPQSAPMQSAQAAPSSTPAPLNPAGPAPVAVAQSPLSPLPPSPTITATPAHTSPPESISSTFPAYKAGTLKAHKGGSVPPILWIVLTIVFFLLYSVVWVKVLGVSLPFLP